MIQILCEYYLCHFFNLIIEIKIVSNNNSGTQIINLNYIKYKRKLKRPNEGLIC